MKITQISYPGFGGLGSVAFSLVGANTGQDVLWEIGFIGDQPLDQALAARCAQFDIAHTTIRTTPGRPYQGWIQLARWLKTRRPDAIICHSINAILACKWYGLWHRVPVIAVEHTPNQVKTRSERAASLMSMLVADRVVLLTEEYREELRAIHGRFFRPGKIIVIPNGIDMHHFHPPTTQKRRQTLRIGMAARFSFSKRQDLLIDTLQDIARARPDLDIELHLAGDGDRLADAQAAAAGQEKVQFAGLLAEANVADWLRGLDIYVHSSEGETLSTSLLQAMATGLPIVASDIPGISNLLQNGTYGQCVPNTVGDFAQAILTLIDQPEKATTMGQRARARIEEHYSTDAMCTTYLNTLRTDKALI